MEELDMNQTVKSSGKSFPCTECSKVYPFKSHLIVHMRSHTGEKPFFCSVCGKSFSRKGDITVHMRAHTGEKPFSCSVCEKSFSRRSKMIVHFRSHTGEKPFCCSVCGKTFSRKSDVSSHEKLHTGEKPYACNICGKLFSQKRYVTLHMKSHTSEKPFPCTICGKTFSRKGFVTQHMIIHTSEKPFSCGLCGKTFCSQRNLIGHMSFHSGKKRVPSLLCGKKKTHERYMAEYTKNKMLTCSNQLMQDEITDIEQVSEMEDSKPLNCGVCRAVFNCWLALKRHLVLHSGDQKRSLCALCNSEISSISDRNQNPNKNTNYQLHFCSRCEKNIPKDLHDYGKRLQAEELEHDCPECRKESAPGIEEESIARGGITSDNENEDSWVEDCWVEEGCKEEQSGVGEALEEVYDLVKHREPQDVVTDKDSNFIKDEETCDEDESNK